MAAVMPPPLLTGSAPVCFGVNEVVPAGAWTPEPEVIIGVIADLGFRGTELGPPGFLGDGPRVRERLNKHGLDLVGSFLPMHLGDRVLELVDRARIVPDVGGSLEDRPGQRAEGRRVH